jgi:hypothetical protein
MDYDQRANVGSQGNAGLNCSSGWATETELVRTFDRPTDIADAIILTVAEAIQQWPTLSATPPLYQFVDVEQLDGLFKTKAVDDSSWIPSVEFQFQGGRVTVLYGSSIHVIVDRNPQ